MAATVAKATGVDAETARQTIIAGIGGFATGRFTTPQEAATLIAVDAMTGMVLALTWAGQPVRGR